MGEPPAALRTGGSRKQTCRLAEIPQPGAKGGPTALCMVGVRESGVRPTTLFLSIFHGGLGGRRVNEEGDSERREMRKLHTRDTEVDQGRGLWLCALQIHSALHLDRAERAVPVHAVAL